ncbi:MAG: hypothetical protein HY812_06735 [Planctomycetes bacterium]|nr:hypothetical protein [Planctomycetota bacterium]
MRGASAVAVLVLALHATARAQYPDPTGPDWKRITDLVLPAFDFARRDVDTWLRQVEETEGRDHDALWSVFYHDDRSQSVVDRLVQVCRTTPDEAARVDIQTLLCHWDVPDPCVPLAFQPSRPPEWLRLDDETLLGELESKDPQRRKNAAVTLASRQRQVRRAARAFIEACHESDDTYWASMIRVRELTGTAWDDAVLEVVADQEASVEIRLFAVSMADLWTAESRETAAQLVAALGFERPSLLPRVLGTLCRLAGVSPYDGHVKFHDPWSRTPLASDGLGRALGIYLPPLVEALLRSDRLTDEQLSTVGRMALHDERLRVAVVPVLRLVMQADGPLSHQALCLLCHLDESDAEIRRRYADFARTFHYSADSVVEVPCLQRHDDETLSLLEELYRKLPTRETAFPLGAAALLDTETSWMAREIVKQHCTEVPWAWLWLEACPVRAVWLPRPDDDNSTKAFLLGLTIRTLRERGQDFSSELERLLDILRGGYLSAGGGGWGDYWLRALWNLEALDLDSPEIRGILIEILINDESFSEQQATAARILARRTLTRREQAMICHLEAIMPTRALDQLLAAQGEASIEVAGRMRTKAWLPGNAEHWSVFGLDDVLAITRPSPNDVALLVAAMRWGTCSERRFAVRMVEEHGVDCPEVRRAVFERREDCDREVAGVAVRLATDLGWDMR